ncbi:MAG TPA: tetratricopeptide repeat protein [Thermoanaerobaculaceae bacterium]|nr:tetratricopeptide repeat protein [Thermoanaerobaculaceae bacterium]
MNRALMSGGVLLGIGARPRPPIEPTMAMAHFHLGTLLVGQGMVPEAIEHLEKYLAMNPNNKKNVATAKSLIQSLK